MTVYVLNEEKMFADIADGVAIVINSDTGIYYGMYELSTAVFDKLTNGFADTDILAALKKLNAVPQDVEQKFNTFVEDLCAKELLIKTNNTAQSGEISFDEGLVQAGFKLEVTEYNDAQELLMADPIHEVKETTGWTPEKESIGYTKEETKEREKKMID